MADIRIKDLPTTATQTASDDFIALDGTVNGTRKIDASAPSFKTSVTSPSVVAPTTTNLTLAGGSTGASLVLGQGAAAANVTLNATTSGFLSFTKSEDSITPTLARLLNAGATTAGRYNEVIFGKSLVNGGAGTIGYKSDSATPANSRLFLVHYGNNQDTGGINLTNTGNLLIGTTTDGGQKLQVAGTSAFTGAVTMSGTGTGLTLSPASGSATLSINGTAAGSAINYQLSGANKYTAEYVSGSDFYAIGRSGVAYDFVLKSGNALIGTTTDGGQKLQVNGSASFAGAVTAGGNVSLSGSAKPTILLNSLDATTNGGAIAFASDSSYKWLIKHATNVDGNLFTIGTATGVFTSTPVLSLNYGTAAATFAGAVTVAGSNSNYLTVASAGITVNSALKVTDGTTNWYTGLLGASVDSTGKYQVFDTASRLSIAPSTGIVSISSTTSASSSTVGALTIGNGTAATNVAIGGGNIYSGGSVYNNGSGYFWDVSGVTRLRAYMATASSMRFFNGSVDSFIFDLANNNLSIAGTTPSTGAGSGALQVAGGIYSGAASVFGSTVTANGVINGNFGGSSQSSIATPSFFAGHANGTTASVLQSGNAARGMEIQAFTDGSNSGYWSIGYRSSTPAFFEHLRLYGGATPSGALATFSGAATFAGAVTAPSATIKRASTSEDAFTNFYTGGSPYWTVGLQAVGTSNDFRIVNAQSGNRSLSISTTTEAATFAGTVIAPAATTAISSVRLPHGAAPTSPVNGDMWTTTAGLYVRINGVTVGPLS